MAKRTVIHVTHNSTSDRWETKRTGSPVPISRHLTKEAAVDAGRKVAKAAPLGQLVIHLETGPIQTEHTYGQDPFPPKG